ncbi:hypothetical protein LSTR_LSTR003083 [Laodelphax striatellus]|uniref:RING-type E3 ubiquitin transferase n=1 Tax=Laodelphax striatellus TaxID=195883 RepID=A0A482WWJ8_LAOST|nr:hypothetical protein LSTR_LSTR003083 [Laodelphax striatellus]
MERPERPSRPEKPNRDHLRNSIRIRRRLTSLLYGMRSPDSTTDSDSEDVINASSSSRRSSSGRRHVTCPFSGGGSGLNDSQPESLLRQSSPPVPVALTAPVTSRNFLDVLRSEPVSSSNVIYTLQPFRSPQRPLPISVNHPLPMFHQHPSSNTTSTASYVPLCSNTGRYRDFNVLMQMQSATSDSGARDLRVSQLGERDRPSTFLVCDESSAAPGPLNPPKRFCPNTNAAASAGAAPLQSSPRHSFAANSSLVRDRDEPVASSSTNTSVAAPAQEFSSSTREFLHRRLVELSRERPRDEISPYGSAGLSGNRGAGNSSFVANLDSTREDSLDGSDVILNSSTAAEGPSPPPSPPPPRPSRPPRFFSVSNLGFSPSWSNPTRDNGSGSSTNRNGGRNQPSRSSLILRAVDELGEDRMNNRRLMGFLDDEVLDEDLVPSSRPASDSDVEIDEDLVRTAVTNLELLRDGGGANNENVSQADDDERASSPDRGQPVTDDQPAADMNFEELAPNSDEEEEEEVVVVSVNSAATAAAAAAEDNEEDNSDANSATTEPAEDLSNDEPFDVVEADAASAQSASVQQDGETGGNSATLLKTLDAEEGQDFNAKLLALLECPVCLETIVPPIRQCRKGHPVCNVCRPRLNVCPTCRTRFTEKDNLLMEKVADMMQFPCKNYVVGCTVSTALKDKTTHELGCGYRQYSCIDRDCQWKGFKQELLVHCNKLHASQVIFSRESAFQSVIIPFELHRQSSFVLSAMDEVFIVTLKVYPHNILRGCTVFLGPPENAKNYYYYFKFGNKSVNKSFKYREMTSPHKTSIHSNEFFQDTCFSYQFEPIFIQSHLGKCVIECKIAVTKPRQQCTR